MKLVSDWKQWPRWWSTFFEAAAAAFFTYITVVPDAIYQTWSALPADIKSSIDPQYIQWAGIALIVAGSISKIIDQPRLNK